jgi:phenylpropionate dioxygenase-like ring-hydroxylating dioxygenase large terminal subunit
MPELCDDFDPTLPLDRAHTIPSRWYFDPAIAERERATAFADWQAVGRLDQLPDAGSYFTIEIAGEPIAVLRDGDGVLRAFHNVCRHRAALVLCEPCGAATKLRCRYHGWTYDLTGKLRGAPEFEGVKDFDRADFGLIPMTVATWGPTIWVHPTAPHQPLDRFIAPLYERTKSFGVDGLRWHARRSYDLACNWKVYVDNYLDGGYHVNYVHPNLAGALDYANYRTELFENCNVQISPLKSAESAAVTAVRSGDVAMYWWMFPNFMVNLYAGVMDTNLVLPLAPDRCRVVFDFYFADGTDAAFKEQSLAVAEQVQQEDIAICEDVQRGLRSRSYTTGRFSVRRENGGYQFHQLLAQSLANGGNGLRLQ